MLKREDDQAEDHEGWDVETNIYLQVFGDGIREETETREEDLQQGGLRIHLDGVWKIRYHGTW